MRKLLFSASTLVVAAITIGKGGLGFPGARFPSIHPADRRKTGTGVNSVGMHYIANPGGDGRDALVVGLRFEMLL